MKETNYSFCTSDNIKIYGKSWESEKNYNKMIIFVHGFGEHLGRYEHVAAFFAEKGCAFVAIDRRGHGQSEGQRGHFPNLERELDDLAQHLTVAKARFPNVPTFIYGHSQGGNFALNWLLRRHPNVTGTIITSPWIALATAPPKIVVTIGKLLNNILPTLSTKAAVGTLSRDPEVDKKYAADPLVHGNITLRGANETMEAADWLANYHEKITTPVLLMHGTGDTVTSCSASQAFYENTQKSIDVKWWEGFYHEMHNEPEKVEVLEYIYNWMEKQV